MTGSPVGDGRHRRHSRARSRGVATWVWAAPLSVVILVGLVSGWWVLSRDAGEEADTDCLAGDLVLTVWADPAAEPVARDLVDRYSATSPVVRDYCVEPSIVTVPTADAAERYRADAPDSAAVWLPVGPTDVQALPGAPENPPEVGTTADGSPVPLVVFGSSPAVPEDAARAGADLQRVVTGQ